MPGNADTLVKTTLGEGYVSETAEVNGTTLHYVRGGQGQAVIHGFPQDWFEYHPIMPRLAKQFTVIAIDLRGVGRSAAAPEGYDAATMAVDVYQLALTLKLQGVYINFGKFAAEDVVHYLEAYATPEQLQAAFEMYRAFPANQQFNAAQDGPNDVPVFVGSGERSPFAKIVPKIAEGLRTHGFSQVETGLILGGVHYLI